MLHNNQRNYLAYADVTLESGTVLNLENEHLLTGGFDREDSISSDESFSALGSAAIGSASIVINDMDGSYADYDFTNAKVVLYVALDIPEGNSTRNEKIKLGTYTVDKPSYRGNAITLTLLDYMEQFDRPYSDSTLAYPASLYTIVDDACTKCGVTLGTWDFPHKNYMIPTRPDDEAITFRDVISWAAAVAGCFARCNADGHLELKWFNQAALENRQGYDGGVFDSASPYATGDTLNGGTFSPWTTGSVADGGEFTDDIPIHYIYGLFSQNMSVDDVVITGVRIIVKNDDVSSASGTIIYMAGAEGYVIEVSDNDFITSGNAGEIVTWLGQQLIGLRFRKATVTHGSDPSIEAGDVGILWDKKGQEHPILITRVTFGIGSSQTIACGAETPSRNSATQYSAATKAFVANRKALRKERTAWQAAQEDLQEEIENAAGLYHTDVQTQSGIIHYLHNKGPNGENGDTTGLNDSDIRIMISDVGIIMTANGTEQTPTWYGLTVNGTLLASVINTMALFFDYAHGGTLTLGGDNNVNGLLRILNATGNEIGSWGKDGISVVKGAINLGNGNFIVTDAGVVTLKNGTFYSGSHTVYNSSNPGFYLGSDGKFGAGDDNYYMCWNGSSVDIKTKTRFGNNVYGSTNYNSNGISIVNGNQEMSLAGYRNNCIALRAESGVSGGYQLISWFTPGEIWLYHWDRSAVQSHISLDNTGLEINGHASNTSLVYEIATGSITVSGTKSRLAKTEDYGERLLYCYETPTPMFGDIGEGVIGEDGQCYISIDPEFAETISTNQYQVFLQKYGDGECFISKRASSYFVVTGTPGLEFGWEMKAKQAGYEMRRLDRKTEKVDTSSEDFGSLAQTHITEINQERIGEAA